MPAPTLKVVEGEVEFVVPVASKPCKTWYKVIGDLRGGARPFVALHGGPGVSHAYLLVLCDLTENYGIPPVVYDQIGTGYSTHLQEKMNDTKFWAEGLYLDELDNLLRYLGIQNDYNILGHSWGGMFGARHATQRPPGLKYLVLASASASMALWIEAQNALRAAPQEDPESTGQKPDGQMDEIPAPIMEGFGWIQKDPKSSVMMTGTSAFKAGGALKNRSMIADAHKIAVPTLLLNGWYDQAQDSVLASFVRQIPRVESVMFEEANHMIHFEERERYMQIVGNFLVRK
ncbi:proline-specific peptidase [Mycena vulgaris]|nr:proline-specific peptidase [Mycena vulgaris]